MTVPVRSSVGRVLLIPESGKVSTTPGGGFSSDFWRWKFCNKPGTIGLLCDPGHPALGGFPAESHRDWPWFHLMMASQPLALGDIPPRTGPRRGSC